ncbi:helix-turn-helix domain-containing protein [Egicoccus sp. AB-alg6-2]|uniref:helix-turn-helix domain-containing protein n=1 Tax=Egicoccus sp. AB-alg6-2 TaxID=3242692 RepID=UPI00359D8819
MSGAVEGAVTLDEPYAVALGERLRSVRQQQDLSLHDVEARSGGDLKASVLGAYERGERAVSITRLHAMAQFFRVPVAELLPEPRAAERRLANAADFDADAVMLDLVALEHQREAEELLVRYADAIKARRGDYNGQVLSVRAADIETLAAVMDTTAVALRARLAAAGLVR